MVTKLYIISPGHQPKGLLFKKPLVVVYSISVGQYKWRGLSLEIILVSQSYVGQSLNKKNYLFRSRRLLTTGLSF